MVEAKRTMTCAMCGYEYDPAAHQGCGSCPFNSGCMLACCPACGYEAPDVERSGLVQLASRLRHKLHSRDDADLSSRPKGTMPLNSARPGSHVRIAAFGDLSPDWSEKLQAYGLAPGREVEVVQQVPVTMVRVEHIDLAFEDRIARDIHITPA